MVACLEMRRQLSVRKLRAAMAKKGWEERDLAYHAKLSLPAVKAILSGESGGRATSLVKIADALEIEDMNVLFDVLQ